MNLNFVWVVLPSPPALEIAGAKLKAAKGRLITGWWAAALRRFRLGIYSRAKDGKKDAKFRSKVEQPESAGPQKVNFFPW
ncbi:MAG: hypothetical protein ONB51_02690 [candidate division KSB1 bacterium]|nr:hypothetical protein [candidate division KSB1 bacterium]